MDETEGTIARPPDSVRCENPQCGEPILLDQSLFSPDADTPPGHIHTCYNENVSSFSALCRHCHHFTVSLSKRGENPLSWMNAPPGE